MHKKYVKLITQLIQGYHLTEEELNDLELYLKQKSFEIDQRRKQL